MNGNVILGGVEYTQTELLQLTDAEFETLRAATYSKLQYHRDLSKRFGRRLDAQLCKTVSIAYGRIMACARTRKIRRQATLESLFMSTAKRCLPADQFAELLQTAREALYECIRCEKEQEKSRDSNTECSNEL